MHVHLIMLWFTLPLPLLLAWNNTVVSPSAAVMMAQ